MAVDSQEAIRLAFLLEPGHSISSTDGFDYLGTRRFLLKTNAQDATLQRHHWQHVSGVGYADFRAFLRAQRDTWRQEREASREEERRAASAAPHADVAHPEADAGQKAQGKVDMGEVSMGEEVDAGKAGIGEVLGELETIQVDGMTVADVHGEEEEGSEERLMKPATETVAAGQSTAAADSSAGAGAGAGAGGADAAGAAASAVPDVAADATETSKSTATAAPFATGSAADSIAAAVAAALGKSEPAPVTQPATTAHVAAAPSKAAASPTSDETEEHREHKESGIEEEVAIRVSASSGAGAAGVSSDAHTDAERGDEEGGNEVAAVEEQEEEEGAGAKRRDGGAGLASSAASSSAAAATAAGVAAANQRENKEQQGESKHKDGKQPPSPPSLPAGFTSSICSVPPEASRNVLPPPPRPGPTKAAAAAGEAEGKKGARRGSEGAGSEGGVGKALERRRSVGEAVAGRGSGEAGPPVRMCAVFDDCLASVNKVQFARHHPDLLAYGAADGTLRLCYVPCSRGGSKAGGAGGKRGAASVARVKQELKGHTKEVTDFDWSTDDDYLCSSSADKSVRVWDVGSGQCLRIIYTLIPQTCIIFHPQNNNFLVVANSKRELTVMNFSTGRVVSRVAMDSNVTALVAHRTTSAPAAAGSATSSSSGGGGAAGKAAASAGAAGAGSSGFGGGAGEADSVVFVGDSDGAIHSFTVDKQSGALLRRHKTVAGVVHPAPVASLHFRPTSVLANGPVLLACSKDGCVRFYTTALELNGYLFLKISLQLSSRATNMNAAFCPPLGPSGSGEYIVTGNADHHVYFYDFMRPRSPLVARVPGHKAMVVDVSWNNSNTVLASCDCDGVVALWQRV
ncbi:unnamed protein product [Closterium sp. NIES-54]